MVKYICEICSTIFMQKGHFEKHKARKRPCTKDNTIEALIEQKVQEALASASALNQVVANIIVEPEEKKRASYYHWSFYEMGWWKNTNIGECNGIISQENPKLL